MKHWKVYLYFYSFGWLFMGCQFTSEEFSNNKPTLQIETIVSESSNNMQDITDVPNGAIVFVSRKDSKNADIFTIASDGGNLQQLTYNPTDDLSPSWSPNGDQIVYVAYPNGNSDDSAEIYILNIDEKTEVRLTENQEYDGEPIWSPNGQQIAFISKRDGNRELYVMEADGSDTIRLTNDVVAQFYPIWGSDGNHLYFLAPQNKDDSDFEVYKINIENLSISQITNGLNIQGSIDISPNERYLAYTTDYKNSNIYVYDLVTGVNSLLNKDSEEVIESTPRWLPDSQHIVFTISSPFGGTQIYITEIDANLESTNIIPIIYWGEYNSQPDWINKQ